MASRTSSCVRDPSTSSNVDQFLSTSLALSLTVDFEARVLHGHCLLEMDVLDSSASQVRLDCRDLHITTVTLDQSGAGGEAATVLQWQVEPVSKTPALGQVLKIDLPTTTKPQEPPTMLKLRIAYATDRTASALQWLDAPQTLGRRHPYVYSQCQDIHARSIVPCQDTPAVKCPYQAEITAPKELTVLMSALSDGDSTPQDGATMVKHRFRQPIPVPSYLVALVCGQLESRELGPRSRVWCESAMVEAAASEFASTEAMLCAAEAITGVAYKWQRYDLLVLPPTFPFGGMENPCLTFVTPTLLAGDRSLVSVIAHEIAHSWTGNLVTNCSWEHFWLNEGHTVYLERLIIEALSQREGAPDSGRVERHLRLQLGYKDLCHEADSIASENLTRLVPDLRDIDPGDYFSRIPYEKGSLLLYFLEEQLGKERMQVWLTAYLKRFAYASIDSLQWKEFLLGSMKAQGVKGEVLDAVDFDAWFYGVRRPRYVPVFDGQLTSACQELDDRWKQVFAQDRLEDAATRQCLLDAYRGFSTHQQFYFWKLLRTTAPSVSPPLLQAMGQLYEMATVTNAEIRFEWLLLCMLKQQDEVMDNMLDFLNSQGRLKYTIPLYKALSQWEAGRRVAVANLAKQRAFMHSTTLKRVDEILAKKSDDH